MVREAMPGKDGKAGNSTLDTDPSSLPAGTQATSAEATGTAQTSAGAPLPFWNQNPSPRPLRPTTIVLVVSLALLLFLTVLGSLMNVGDHLMQLNPILGGLFYLLVLVLLVAGVVLPLVNIARRPVFSLYQLRDEAGHAKRRHCKMLADNLLANADLSPEQRQLVQAALMAGDKTDDILIDFFTRTFIPRINAQTRRCATTAFFSTAISHSALIDTVTMLSVSLNLVQSIVEICGFRPTNLGLARLYGRILISALIAGGLDDADLDGLVGAALGGGAGARSAGILLGSTASGMVSAFLVFRMGVITREWLCSSEGPARMAAIRRRSYREALSLMRSTGFMGEIGQALKHAAGSAVKGTATAAKNAAKHAASSAVQATTGFVSDTARHSRDLAGRLFRRKADAMDAMDAMDATDADPINPALEGAGGPAVDDPAVDGSSVDSTTDFSAAPHSGRA